MLNVPGAEGQAHTRLMEAGHFLQDDQGPAIAERLVRLDLPELDLSPEQPRDVEIFRGDDWERHRIEKFSADGRVCVVPSAEPGAKVAWVDLSKHRFRYVS